MQFAAAADLERVGCLRLRHAQRDVRIQFAPQPVAQLARREILAVLAGERRRVDAEEHRDGRLVDGDGVDRLGHFGVGKRVADVDPFDSGDADDVAGRRLLDLDPFQPGER